jgi:threonine synthase
VLFCGDHTLAAVCDSGGLVTGVHDEEVLAMQGWLAREEGIWVEPAGAAAVASLSRLEEKGELAPDQQFVCILSGAGFKDRGLAAASAGTAVRSAKRQLSLDNAFSRVPDQDDADGEYPDPGQDIG